MVRGAQGEPRGPVSRVLYPPEADGDHLSSPPFGLGRRVPQFRQCREETMLPSGSSGQPGDGPDTHGPPIRPCSRWGLAVAASPQTTGRSYRPISPLPPYSLPPIVPSSSPNEPGGGMFLCHFPYSASLQNPGCYPAPRPVEPGLSSLPINSGRRSPGLPGPLNRTLA